MLDFPVIGERFLKFSLDPRYAQKAANSSEITEMLKKQIGNRSDSAEISKGIEEFFIYSSEFMRFKAIKKYPTQFSAVSRGDIFIMQKTSDNYLYTVESSVLNQNFFERVQFKIFSKSKISSPIMTLFLIPQSCE